MLPPQPASTTVSPSSFQGGLSTTGRVSLTTPAASDTAVSLSVVSGGSAVSSMPTSVIIPATFSSATWTIQTSQVTVSTQVKISATLNGLTKYGYFTVGPLAPSLGFSPTSLSGGSTTTGKVSFLVPVNATFLVNTQPVGANTTVNISSTANGGIKSATFSVH